MIRTGWRAVLLVIATVAMGMLAGCGGSGSGGGGIISSAGSLAIALSSTTVASGSPVTATVTLTALTGSPVNGIEVQVVSNDPSVIGTYKGYTNTSGIVTIQLPTQVVGSDKIISLYATSNGITPSTTTTVTVVAPKLTINIPTAIPGTFTSNSGGNAKLVTSGYQLKFLDGSGNPITNQVITLSVDSLTGKDSNDQIVYTPVQGTTIIAPPGVFTGTTDSSGIVSIPMYIQMALGIPAPCATDPTTGVYSCTGTVLSVMTANWRAVAVYGGQTYTTTSSSGITFTNTGS
jgi:hypothetical protein